MAPRLLSRPARRPVASGGYYDLGRLPQALLVGNKGGRAVAVVVPVDARCVGNVPHNSLYTRVCEDRKTSPTPSCRYLSTALAARLGSSAMAPGRSDNLELWTATQTRTNGAGLLPAPWAFGAALGQPSAQASTLLLMGPPHGSLRSCRSLSTRRWVRTSGCGSDTYARERTRSSWIFLGRSRRVPCRPSWTYGLTVPAPSAR
jgi:hypothetical protein